jgi:hypothetical protein
LKLKQKSGKGRTQSCDMMQCLFNCFVLFCFVLSEARDV